VYFTSKPLLEKSACKQIVSGTAVSCADNYILVMQPKLVCDSK